MKRILWATLGVGLVAGVLATVGVAQPAATGVAAGPEAAEAAKAAALPRLPAEVRNRQRWIIGVKCDTPPFGYINVQGKNAGFDVEIARWFARFAFGKANRVA